jgi:hypothetical protein
MLIGPWLTLLLLSGTAGTHRVTGASPTCPDCQLVRVGGGYAVVGTPIGIFNRSVAPTCRAGTQTATGIWSGSQIRVPLNLTFYASMKVHRLPLVLGLPRIRGSETQIFIPN